MNGKKCRYLTCVRISRPRSDECQACATRYSYWDKQSSARRMERRRRLEMSNQTMSEFVTDTKLRVAVKKGYQKEVRNAE